MLVSVVMPCYNAKEHIVDSINSVLKQTYVNLELIVVDDNSLDGTFEIIQSNFSDDLRVKIITNTLSKGAGGARACGIKKSSGRFIAFLDSDDLWVENKLSLQIAFMVKSGYSFTYTHYLLFQEGKRLGVRYANPKATFKDLLSHCTIGNSTVIIDRNYISPLPEYPLCQKEDYAFWLRITGIGYDAHLCPIVGTQYRLDVTSVSGKKYKEIIKQYRVLRNEAGKSVLVSMNYVLKYIFLGLFVRLKLKFSKYRGLNL